MLLLLLLLVAVAVATIATTPSHAAEELTFRYDPDEAAGVRAGSKSPRITADLDFSRVRPEVLRRLGCPDGAAREYEWHVHVRWPHRETSAALGRCAKAETGNHLDPALACGPQSEFADTGACRNRVHGYRCSPARYREDPRACERGDLSGKLGNLVLNRAGRVRGSWVDRHFPAPAEVSPQRNIILHPACRPSPLRLACAVVQRRDGGGGGRDDDDKDN